MRFEPETNLLQSGEVDLVFADGAVKTMSFERLGNQIAFLRCGMYGGPNGGTPDGDLWHGMPVAAGDEVVVHGETFDVNDPDVRSRLAGQDQHHCRVTCDGEVTYGLVEPYDTLCYEVAKAGRHGLLAARSDDLTPAAGAASPRFVRTRLQSAASRMSPIGFWRRRVSPVMRWWRSLMARARASANTSCQARSRDLVPAAALVALHRLGRAGKPGQPPAEQRLHHEFEADVPTEVHLPRARATPGPSRARR